MGFFPVDFCSGLISSYSSAFWGKLYENEFLANFLSFVFWEQIFFRMSVSPKTTQLNFFLPYLFSP